MATIYAGKGRVNSTNPYISLTVSQGSQSIEGNYTIVPFSLKVHRPGSVSSSASKDYSFKVAGTTYSGTYTIGGSGTKVIKSGTMKVYHDDDGSKKISYSISTEIGVTWSGTYIGTVSNSGSMTLSTIPRATVPTLSATSATMGTEITIDLPRAVDSFTHDLAYSFAGSDFVTIATDVATSAPWVVPDLAEAIPNAASGTLTIQCITKNGDTLIGSKQYAALTAVVPGAYIPSVSSVRRSEATAGLAEQFGAYVQGKSKLAVEIDGTGVAGSTITGYQATLGGKVYEAQSFTSDLLATAGTQELKVRVQDSRGRWSDYMTIDVEVLEYSTPKIQTFQAYRSDARGNAKDDGEYVTLQLHYSVSPLGNNNTASGVVSYDNAPADEYTSLLTLADLSVDRAITPQATTFTSDTQFDLQLVVTDWFGATATAYALLPTADVVLDINADGSAIAFGKVSEVSDAVEVARSFMPLGPVASDMQFDNVKQIYGTSPDGTVKRAFSPCNSSGHTMIGYDNYQMSEGETQIYGNALRLYSREGVVLDDVTKQSLLAALGIVDYVVEQGTDGIWTYRKMASGLAECWGTQSVSAAINVATGDGYRSDIIEAAAYPTGLFIAAPEGHIQSCGVSGYLCWVARAYSDTTEDAGKFYLMRTVSQSAHTYPIRYEARGRWK